MGFTGRSPQGIILAGGRATRLGPLTAQLNKALVTVGQQPVLVRHVQQLRRQGCGDIFVVVSPSSAEQVQNVIERAGLPNVKCVVQDRPRGPGNALKVAAQGGAANTEWLVLMADTILDDGDLPTETDTVTVAPAPTSRQFCVQAADENFKPIFEDREAREGEPVAVGAFRFSNPDALTRYIAWHEREEGELGMAPVLNGYRESLPLRVEAVQSWEDVGDVAALARANQRRLISRDHTHVEVTRPGLVIKRGTGHDFVAEMREVRWPPKGAEHLYPRVFDHSRDHYTMEHIDLPSLAELWLYWPSVPAMWEHVAERMLDELDSLWSAEPPIVQPTTEELRRRAEKMWLSKLDMRYVHPNIETYEASGRLEVNGQEVIAGRELVERVLNAVRTHVVSDSHEWMGHLHGDPNFTNVLWSLRTGSFKLLDPRGTWGGEGSVGDIRYDVAKIAYSPIFSPIAHDLFTLVVGRNGSHALRLWPRRLEETGALLRGLERRVDAGTLRLLMVYMLLSSAPLHSEPQASALYMRAASLATEIAQRGVL